MRGVVSILLLGANHDTAAVAVRECLAIPAERIVDTLRFLKSSTGEITVISTCNRTEFYAASTDADRILRHFIYEHSGLDPGTLDRALYRLEGREAVDHLLRVACGLDSMIVGEPQILGQVREALQVAQDAGSAGPVITALFQAALNAGKTARAVTGISRGALSVSQAAVDLAERELGPLADVSTLVIGAGETGAAVARNLRSRGVAKLTIANRTFETAEHLAADLHGSAVHLSGLPEAIERSELVISSTGAPLPVITKQLIDETRRAERTTDLLMVDIAIPRDIEPGVSHLSGVKVVDLDDLSDLIQSNLDQRLDAAVELEADIEQRTEDFLRWLAGHSSGETIRDLFDHANDIRLDQLERALRRLPNLDARERERLEIFSLQLVNALLHQPVSQVWDWERGASNAEALRRIFGLEPDAPLRQPEEKKRRINPAA
jgi:glutamyl-tRNA reductase